MGSIRVQGISKQYGPRVVLNDVTVEMHSGERVGLVGTNGAGKTTLFKIFAGMVTPDSGTVTCSKGTEIGYLAQEPEVAEGRTLHDEVLSVFKDLLDLEQRLHQISDQMAHARPGAELDQLMKQYDRTTTQFETAGGYQYEQRLQEILGGLGFSESDYSLSMSALSGGQKCRAALAKLLLKDSTFLLLDEPTNHLDIDAVRWLEKFLAGYEGGIVVISHDRYLLDRVADRIVEVDRGKTYSYPGNYSSYVQVRDLRRLTQQREFEKDQEFIAKERDFIARHMAGQRSAEAKGRLTRLERMLADGEFVTDRPTENARLKIRIEDADSQPRDGQELLVVEELAKSYGPKTLFADLSLRIIAGERLGITGPNGTGKSTLLRILMDHVQADHGKFRFSGKAQIGYFAQEAAALAPETTVVDQILAVRPELLEAGARSYAARFLFRGEDVYKRMGMLSGGEQSRVRLMTLLLTGPNTLILDEPTNHLDIPAREALEQALIEFPGTIIAVSHDRYFLDRICSRLLVIRDGSHTLHAGNYSSYVAECERIQEEAEIRAAAESGARRAKGARPAPQEQRRKQSKPVSSRFMRFDLEELEQFIAEKEAALAAMNDRFGDPAIYQDPAALATLQSDYDETKASLTEAEAEWLERSA